MCVAIPGKVISLENNKAKIDISGNVFEADVSLVSPKVGDYVLVHAGVAIEILKKEQAEEIISIFAELENVL